MTTTAAPTNSAIVTDYRARTPGSGALFERARKVLPSGITHDGRYLDPYSIHVGKAKGPGPISPRLFPEWSAQ